jgi:hypothetical protein
VNVVCFSVTATLEEASRQRCQWTGYPDIQWIIHIQSIDIPAGRTILALEEILKELNERQSQRQMLAGRLDLIDERIQQYREAIADLQKRRDFVKEMPLQLGRVNSCWQLDPWMGLR